MRHILKKLTIIWEVQAFHVDFHICLENKTLAEVVWTLEPSFEEMRLGQTLSKKMWALGQEGRQY